MSQKDMIINNVNNLDINHICNELQVSPSTVKNWIKAGELILNKRGFITKKSFNTFKKNIIGQTKLNKRANKSQKYKENTDTFKQQLLQELTSEMLDPEYAGDTYQSLLSDSEKNKQGIYYTPPTVVADITKNIKNINNRTFCDPCCGSGNFIVQALQLGFNPKSIYGFDSDPIAISIAQARFKKITGQDGTQQIRCLDFLKYSLDNPDVQYDYIYTNPPWGQKLRKTEKQNLAKQFSLSSDIVNDTCSLFFMVCLMHIKQQGQIGFLMPDAVFNVGIYEPLRRHILNSPVIRFCDYGKPFKGLQTGAVLIEINQSHHLPCVVCQTLSNNFIRNIDTFKNNPKHIINITCTPNEANVIDHLYQLPHSLLNNNIEWGIGIVTGNNAKHIKPKPNQNTIAVFKGSDISPNQLKEPTSFIDNDFSLYQQVAPLRLYQAKEKLIYRFISSKLIFYYDDKQCYILNSANMLIPTNNFNYSLKLLADILNSDFMNWLFHKLFNTHKILRSDLECLPIYFHLVKNNVFNEEDYIKQLGLERLGDGTYRIKK